MSNSTNIRNNEKAVAALKRLPLGDQYSAFREAVSNEMKRQADIKFGIKCAGMKSWRKLTDTKAEWGEELPGDDHTELRKGNVLTYISQPYQLYLKHMREIVRICDDQNLEFMISANSWYSPASTISIIYARKGDLLKL
jgi:hypothetical protein